MKRSWGWKDKEEVDWKARYESWSNDLVIVSVGANPEPVDSTLGIETKRSIVIADPYRPELSDVLQAKRRMPRIGFHKREVLISQGANVFGEGLIGGPKS